MAVFHWQWNNYTCHNRAELVTVDLQLHKLDINPLFIFYVSYIKFQYICKQLQYYFNKHSRQYSTPREHTKGLGGRCKKLWLQKQQDHFRHNYCFISSFITSAALVFWLNDWLFYKPGHLKGGSLKEISKG